MKNQEKIFSDYYESKLALDALTKKVADKRQGLVDALKTYPGNRMAIPGARFSLRAYKSYKFSPVVQEAKMMLADRQKKEIDEGIATVAKETFTPVMNQIQTKGVKNNGK